MPLGRTGGLATQVLTLNSQVLTHMITWVSSQVLSQAVIQNSKPAR
jgi:hypothetical protein